MASFIPNMFNGPGKNSPGKNGPGKDGANKLNIVRPSTPVRNSFVEPARTPTGSPSKRSNPPGALELPQALESSLKLSANVFDTPIKLGRPQSVIRPLSPGKGNPYTTDVDMTNADIPEESILQRGGPSTPLKHQGQENTPPTTTSKHAPTQSVQHNHAALSRQDVYQSPRTVAHAKKFDTSRGLTAEEKEILQKPNVRRLVNVTQLCKPLAT